MAKADTKPFNPGDRLLRFKDLQLIVPFSKVHINNMERDGKFPKRIRFGVARVAWLESDILKWIKDMQAENVTVTVEGKNAGSMAKARAARSKKREA